MYIMNFWSRFHRIFHFSFDFLGFVFDYKGDEVTWLWPWKRTDKKKKWLSIGFECDFNNLQELDDAWNDYAEAMKQ